MRRAVLLGVVAALVTTWVAASTSARPLRPSGPVENPSRGLVYGGLTHDHGECGHSFRVETKLGDVICTHGPDPAPAGVDVRTRSPILQPSQRDAGAPTGTIECIGNGSDGPRVQAIYAVSSDVTDRSATVLPSIRHWAEQVEGVVEESAAETGGVRGIRWLTQASGGGCELVVDHVVMPPSGDDSFGNTIDTLRALGYLRSDRRYLAWVDADLLCGIGGFVTDDSHGVGNANNGVIPLFSRVDSGCWGLLDQFTSGPNFVSVEGHEMMHNFGAVQESAPNSTNDSFGTIAGGHCFDEYDNMCYDDDSNPGTFPLQILCPESHGPLLDCNHDDYFHTSPASGSYLDQNWNSANSIFFNETPFPTSQHLTVTKSGAGGGTVEGELFFLKESEAECQAAGLNCSWVNSAPNFGIDCGSQCSTDVTTNSLINLVATPQGSAEFGGWTGDCVQTDERNEGGKVVGICTISAGAPTQVNARFASSAPQPDLEIGIGSGTKIGNDIYNATGADQAKSATVKKGKGKTFEIRLTNDSIDEDNIKIKGTGKSKDFTVKYVAGGQDITSFVVAGNININNIPANAFTEISVTIKSKSSASKGDKKTVKVTATSLDDGTRVDVVKATLKLN